MNTIKITQVQKTVDINVIKIDRHLIRDLLKANHMVWENAKYGCGKNEPLHDADAFIAKMYSALFPEDKLYAEDESGHIYVFDPKECADPDNELKPLA